MSTPEPSIGRLWSVRRIASYLDIKTGSVRKYMQRQGIQECRGYPEQDILRTWPPNVTHHNPSQVLYYDELSGEVQTYQGSFQDLIKDTAPVRYLVADMLQDAQDTYDRVSRRQGCEVLAAQAKNRLDVIREVLKAIDSLPEQLENHWI